jgi:TM2 domain-containing membrane protein YozV
MPAVHYLRSVHAKPFHAEVEMAPKGSSKEVGARMRKKMQMSSTDLAVLSHEMMMKKRSETAMWVQFIVFGVLGVHRLYVGHRVWGLYPILAVLTVIAKAAGTPWLFTAGVILVIMLIKDVYSNSVYVEEANRRIELDVAARIYTARQWEAEERRERQAPGT